MAIVDNERIEKIIHELLRELGHIDTALEPELAATPARVALLLRERFAPWVGLPTLGRIDNPGGSAVIAVRSLPFHAMCVHHMVPFFGTVDIAYAPDSFIAGFGAFERLVEAAARGPQLQERMTARLVQAIVAELEPRGVVVRVEARQMCMELTGAGHRSHTVVIEGAGAWRDHSARVAAELFS